MEEKRVKLKDVKPNLYEIKYCGKVLEWKIANAWKVEKKLNEIQKGDVFEIKGIGRMRVVYAMVLARPIHKDLTLYIKRFLVRSDD